MKKQVAVIGLGRFGISLARGLYNAGHDVLAVDIKESNVQDISSEVTHAVRADATNESVLKELGIQNFDIGIVAIGTHVESSVMATILLKRLGVKYIIARAQNELHGSILDKIGANRVVYPERESGIRVALQITLTDVLDYMSITARYGVARLTAPVYFFDKSLSELGFGPEGKWEVAVLLIQRENEITVMPRQKEIVRENDVLLIGGSDDKLEKLLFDARDKAEEEAKEKEKEEKKSRNKKDKKASDK